MIQSGGFLGGLRGPLLKTGFPLMNDVIKPLPKSVLIPLGITAAAAAAAAAAANARIHKVILESRTTALITSNNQMENIMKVVKSLEDLVYY